MDIDDITRLGGLAATYELHLTGWTKHHLRRAVLDGSIIRVRQGWYCLPSTDVTLQQAVRVGGQVTCVTAARLHGLAVRNAFTTHVVVPRSGSRLRHPLDKSKRLSSHPSGETIVHWSRESPASDRFVAGPLQCLRDMIGCQSPEWVVAAADSAIRAGLISRAQWRREIRRLPRRLRELLARIDPRSESILESIMRFRLRMLGFEARVQVAIRGVGRVDLVVGDRLVIELDGWEFHSDREAFEEDRQRDAVLAARGYRVLRFTYRQLTSSWSVVRAAVLGCIERSEHVW